MNLARHLPKGHETTNVQVQERRGGNVNEEPAPEAKQISVVVTYSYMYTCSLLEKRRGMLCCQSRREKSLGRKLTFNRSQPYRGLAHWISIRSLT